MASVLEVLFLAICLILIGFGLSELKKKHSYPKNVAIILLGGLLAVTSLYMAKLFLEG